MLADGRRRPDHRRPGAHRAAREVRRPRPRRRMAGDDRPAVRLRGLGGARGGRHRRARRPLHREPRDRPRRARRTSSTETAAETGLAPAILRDYFTRNLRYRMGPAEQAGLAEFLRRAEAHGLTSSPAALRFAHTGFVASSAARHPAPSAWGAGSTLLQELLNDLAHSAAESGTSWCFSLPPR